MRRINSACGMCKLAYFQIYRINIHLYEPHANRACDFSLAGGNFGPFLKHFASPWPASLQINAITAYRCDGFDRQNNHMILLNNLVNQRPALEPRQRVTTGNCAAVTKG
jgi:hypothetical protein